MAFNCASPCWANLSPIPKEYFEENLAWLEDMIPWYYTDQYVRLKNSCTTPMVSRNSPLAA